MYDGNRYFITIRQTHTTFGEQTIIGLLAYLFYNSKRLTIKQL